MADLTPISGDEHFVQWVRDFHGLDISLADVDALHSIIAEEMQRSQRYRYELSQCDDVWLAEFEIVSGKSFGRIIGSVIGVATAAVTGQWWAAGLALLSGVLSLTQRRPEPEDEEERFDPRFGFEQGGQLAPSGGILPRIYCNRNINPSGGVRVGGILIHSRVEVRRGVSILYQLFLIGAGQSEQLGYGQIGAIDDDATLFNAQPRSNYTPREITTYTRLGTQTQSAIPQFSYYCQNIAPPDYKVFGIDERAKVSQASTISTGSPTLVNAVYTDATTVGKTTAGDGWNAGVFSDLGLTGPGNLSFNTTSNVVGVGLSSIDVDQNWTSIQHGFYFDAAGDVYVVESGTIRTSPVPAANGLYVIEVTISQVRYFANNALIYTSAIAPVFPLFPDIALFTGTANGGSTVGGINLSGVGGIGVGGTLATFINPTLDQADGDEDLDILALFNAGQDYVIQNTGDLSIDDTFIVTEKNIAARSLVTAPAVNAPAGADIYSYWVAKYETTKRVDRVDFNLQINLSARHKGDDDDKNNGKLVTHGLVFDLWIRPVTDPLGSEVRLGRFLVKDRGTGPVLRAIRVQNLALGRYYFEIRPLTTAPGGFPIYELNDAGYNTNDTIDAEDLPSFNTGVVVAGNTVFIQSELELATNGILNVPGGLYGNAAIVQTGLELVVNPATAVLPEFAQSPSVMIPGNRIDVVVLNSLPVDSSTAFYGLSLSGATSGPPEFGWGITRDALTAYIQAQRYANGAAVGSPVVVAVGTVLSYELSGTNVNLYLNFANTTTYPTGGALLFPSVELPVDSVVYPAPDPIIDTTPIAAGLYSLSEVQKWVGYDRKTQVSSERGPVAQVTSVNEIVHPAALGKPLGGDPYAGYALQGHRFIASERLQQPPGVRTLVSAGTVCPNWIAAGRAAPGSARSTNGVCDLATDGSGNYFSLYDPTASFISDGVLTGYILRNFDTGQEAQITAITETTIATDAPLCFDGDDHCSHRYGIYFLGSTAYFPDVFADIARNDFGGLPEILSPDEFLDYPSIVEARRFCVANQYYFDDIVASGQPFAEWVVDHARLSKLFPAQIDGRFGLIPDTPRTIDHVFNGGNSRNFNFQFPDWQPEITNTVVIRYVDGRDIFTQSGARHRLVTITVQTPDAAAGSVPLITEEIDAKAIKNTEQAITVACMYLKNLRNNNKTVTFETSWSAAYIVCGDIISVQSSSYSSGGEYAGSVSGVIQNGAGHWMQLDCQPVLKTGFVTGGTFGGITIEMEQSTISAGDLLINCTTGQSAVITAINQAPVDNDYAAPLLTFFAPLDFAAGDEYEIVDATAPTDFVTAITYRETGVTAEFPVNYSIIDGQVWVDVPAGNEAPRYLDQVNIAPITEKYRVLAVNPNGREVFEISAALFDEDVFTRNGLVVEVDDTVVSF